MKLPVLSTKSLKGKRVLVRVDWNVPWHGLQADDSLKLLRTIPDLKSLAERGAVVIVATHLGRPTKREKELSTRRLLPLLKHRHKLEITFLEGELEKKKEREAMVERLEAAKPGSIFLLENVRFFKGEETNSLTLSKAYAELADIFVNDAFASSHRAHASVAGVAKRLPHFAGPALVEEVENLEKLLKKPARPFVAIVGGAKLSTKIGVLKECMEVADKVLVGGAMANVFFAAKKIEVGKSLVEKSSIAIARRLMKNPKLVLPVDVTVTTKLDGGKVRVTKLDKIKKTEIIGDIGPLTMQAWAAEIKRAKTIMWNGPVGVTWNPSLRHGSTLVARVVAERSRGKAFGVVGGGDTLPVALGCGMAEWFDFVSTGGGAMLEFVAREGKLVGLEALTKK